MSIPRATELHVTMPDGSVWSVPAHVIADNRARYYAEKDEDSTYEDEYDFTLRDWYELTDWAAGNMNWSDVASVARQLPALQPGVDYQEGWVNGEKRVVREAGE